MEIKPQEGPQTTFLSTDADIAFFGGAAGGGKSYALLLDALRHVSNPDCGTVFFRRTNPQITAEGSLWDTAQELYMQLGASQRQGPTRDLTFPHPTNPDKKGYRVTFSSMQHEKNKYDFQGSQIPVIMFDEVTQFSKTQFMYLVGRNRSTCGIKPYVRATCNPDKTSWVRDFIDFFIDDNGFAIPERSGVLRYLCVADDKENWFDSREEAIKQFPDIPPLSITFIPSKLSDNKILMEQDPLYLAKLMSLSKLDRQRLLDANWDVIASSGMYFKQHYFEEIDYAPPMIRVVRCWDRAATEHNPGDQGDPDYTAGVKIGQTKDGEFIILDIIRERLSAGKVETLILNTARQDGVGVTVKGFQDPGSAGKGEAENFVKMLSGFIVKTERISVDKETAAKPLSAQAESGNVKILSSCRNKDSFYSELENFPDDSHDDIVDASSGAFNELNAGNVGQFTSKFNNDNIRKDIPAFKDTW